MKKCVHNKYEVLCKTCKAKKRIEKISSDLDKLEKSLDPNDPKPVEVNIPSQLNKDVDA